MRVCVYVLSIYVMSSVIVLECAFVSSVLLQLFLFIVCISLIVCVASLRTREMLMPTSVVEMC